MARKLNQYKGSLTAKDVAAGMNAAARNADRLHQDAQLLLDAHRFPTAAALAMLSIEEAGKVSVLRGLALARSEAERSASWKEYRSHIHKNASWMLPSLVAGGARLLDEMRPLFEPGAEHRVLGDQLKQVGLYTDCLGKCHWSEPIEVIDERTARTLVSTAGVMASVKPTTARDIELWREHLGPVWMTSLADMKNGLLRWRSAMIAEGLAENDLDQFVRFVATRDPAKDPDPTA